MIDAPVSGGEHKAIDGALPRKRFMLGTFRPQVRKASTFTVLTFVI